MWECVREGSEERNGGFRVYQAEGIKQDPRWKTTMETIYKAERCSLEAVK